MNTSYDRRIAVLEKVKNYILNIFYHARMKKLKLCITHRVYKYEVGSRGKILSGFNSGWTRAVLYYQGTFVTFGKSASPA